MKKIINKIAFATLALTPSLFAHEGHVHQGTSIEILVHNFVTSPWFLFPAILLIAFLSFKNYRKRKTAKL
ncbi:MAG: hypothetical protein IPH62_13415 [Ignavibacteriae bacterium]|nr:hypothetical protein [Ignavibacteriota bacterium]